MEFVSEREAGQKFWEKYKKREQKLFQSAEEMEKREKKEELMRKSILWRAYCKLKKI